MRPGVELDDELVLFPQGVDGEAFDDRVEGGNLDVAVDEELKEAALELPSRVLGFGVDRADGLLQLSRPVPSVAAGEQFLDCT